MGFLWPFRELLKKMPSTYIGLDRGLLPIVMGNWMVYDVVFTARVYIYIYTRCVYMYICTYVRTYGCMHACMDVNVCMSMYV